MTQAWIILGAAGLGLFVSGLPGLRPIRLRERVTPYVEDGARRANRSFGALTLRGDGVPRAGGAMWSIPLLGFAWGMSSVALMWSLILAQLALGIPVSPLAAAIATGLAFGTGFVARQRWASRRLRGRMRRIEAEIPVVMDLVAMGVMAGRSIPESLERISRSFGSETGLLLKRVVAELRSGSPADRALDVLEREAPIAPVFRFVDAIRTAMERGTPTADVLRDLSRDVRDAELRRVLEAAGKREIAMLVPVVFLILPVIVAIALLPGLVSLDLLVP